MNIGEEAGVMGDIKETKITSRFLIAKLSESWQTVEKTPGKRSEILSQFCKLQRLRYLRCQGCHVFISLNQEAEGKVKLHFKKTEVVMSNVVNHQWIQ